MAIGIAQSGEDKDAGEAYPSVSGITVIYALMAELSRRMVCRQASLSSAADILPARNCFRALEMVRDWMSMPLFYCIETPE